MSTRPSLLSVFLRVPTSSDQLNYILFKNDPSPVLLFLARIWNHWLKCELRMKKCRCSSSCRRPVTPAKRMTHTLWACRPIFPSTEPQKGPFCSSKSNLLLRKLHTLVQALMCWSRGSICRHEGCRAAEFYLIPSQLHVNSGNLQTHIIMGIFELSGDFMHLIMSNEQ